MALVYLYIATLPLLSVSLLNVGGRGFGRLDWLMGAALCVATCLFGLFGRVRLRWSSISTFVLIYLCTVALNLGVLFDSRRSQLVDYTTVAAQQILVAGVFFSLSSLPLSERQLRNVLRAWALAALLVAIYGLYQVPARLYGWPFSHVTLTDPRTAPGGYQTGRAFAGFYQISSVLREPTWFGSYLQGPLIVFGAILLGRPSSAQPETAAAAISGPVWPRRESAVLSRPLLGAGTLVVALALVLSVALGTYVAFLGTVLVALSLNRRLRWPTTRVVLLSLVLLIATDAVLSSISDIEILSTMSYRVEGLLSPLTGKEGDTTTSLEQRVQRMTAAIEVWADHPLLGVGLNNTHYLSASKYINSGWVKLLSSQGLVGLASMGLLLASCLYALRRMAVVVGPHSWLQLVLLSLFYLIISDAIDTMITFDWASPIRWFSISLANMTLLRAKQSQRELHAVTQSVPSEPRAGISGSSMTQTPVADTSPRAPA